MRKKISDRDGRLRWTNTNDLIAFGQGWRLTRHGRITREAALSIFETDEDAIKFVKKQVLANDPLAIKALNFHETSRPPKVTPQMDTATPVVLEMLDTTGL